MLNGKAMIIHLIVGLIKKIWFDSIGCNCIKMSQYFPKPYEPFGGDINVKVIYLVMQQKQILKIFHMLIHQVLH